MNFKKHLLTAALFVASGVSAFAWPYAGVRVGGPGVGVAVGVAPGPGYVWTAGHWGYPYGRRVWVEGAWVPPAPVYAAPYYARPYYARPYYYSRPYYGRYYGHGYRRY